jgi:hypothetical protein
MQFTYMMLRLRFFYYNQQQRFTTSSTVIKHHSIGELQDAEERYGQLLVVEKSHVSA